MSFELNVDDQIEQLLILQQLKEKLKVALSYHLCISVAHLLKKDNTFSEKKIVV